MIAIAEKYSVEAVLKATGASQFTKAFRDASKSVQGIDKSTSGASVSIGKMLTAVAGVAAAVGVFRTLRGAVDGAISRFDTLNNFPRVLQLMGFEADESERAIQRLSDGIDGLPTTLDSVAGTAQRIAVMTGDLDGAVETTLALNNAFLASGSSANDAQRGLEQYVQMLAKGEVDLQSWRTLQETMPVALNKTAEAFGYTGASAQNDLYEALKEGEITFDEFNAQLIELSEETGGFADMAKTSSTGIRTSWTNIQTAVVKGVADMLASIDEALASFGGISGVLDSVKVGIQTVFGFINANIPTVIDYIRTVYEYLKQWAPVIIGVATTFLTFYTVIGVINSVKTAVSTARTGLMLLYTTMAANPVALVIAVLAGLAAMFIYLWNTSDTFREGVTNAFNTLKEFVMPIIQSVVDFVMEIWGYLVTWWQENHQMILEAAQNVWMFISEFIQTAMEVIWNIMQTLWPFIKAIIIDTWEAIKGAIQGAVEVITGIIEFFAALFTGNWGALWDAIKTIVSGAVRFVWNFVQLWFVGKILKAGKALFTGLRSVVSSLWNAVKSLFTSGVNTARNVVNTGFNFIRNIISTVMNGVRSIISNIWSSIRGTTSSVVNAIRNTIRNIFNSLKGIVRNAFNGVRNAVKNGITGALNIIKNMFSSFKNAGKNIVTSIADGIKGAISKVTDAIGNVVGKVRDFLPFSPAKEGPLKDIHRLDFAGPISTSVRRATPKIQAMLQNMLALPQVDIAGQVARTNSSINTNVTHSINQSNSRIEMLLEKIANSNQVVVLDSGELVGATYNKYDRMGGNRTVLAERWGR